MSEALVSYLVIPVMCALSGYFVSQAVWKLQRHAPGAHLTCGYAIVLILLTLRIVFHS